MQNFCEDCSNFDGRRRPLTIRTVRPKCRQAAKSHRRGGRDSRRKVYWRRIFAAPVMIVPRNGAGIRPSQRRAGRGEERSDGMAIILGVAIPISFLLLLLSVHPGLCPELATLAWISTPFWLPAACISLLTYFD